MLFCMSYYLFLQVPTTKMRIIYFNQVPIDYIISNNIIVIL